MEYSTLKVLALQLLHHKTASKLTSLCWLSPWRGQVCFPHNPDESRAACNELDSWSGEQILSMWCPNQWGVWSRQEVSCQETVITSCFLNSGCCQLPHQQHDHTGPFPHQLQNPLLRELLPTHRAGGELWRPLWGTGHQPTWGTYVQSTCLPHTERTHLWLRGGVSPLLAHFEKGEAGPLCVPWPTQCGADWVEALHPGSRQANPGGLSQRAWETCPWYEAEGKQQGWSNSLLHPLSCLAAGVLGEWSDRKLF